MATVITGLTAERMKEIEDATIVDSEIRSGNLFLIKHDGNEIDCGPVTGPPGPPGPVGPVAISAIPGEVKLWPGKTLPDLALYGKWVWADGYYYPNAAHPKAASALGYDGSKWRTFDGQSDPGINNFRVPDLRGLVPAGLDQMPVGSPVGRASRMTRLVAITLAERTGRETYDLKLPELAKHLHTVNSHSHGGITGDDSPDHAHGGTTNGENVGHTHIVGSSSLSRQQGTGAAYNVVSGLVQSGGGNAPVTTSDRSTGHTHTFSTGGAGIRHKHGIGAEAPNTTEQGDGTAHENVQPTVFVPYIVYLDVV